MLKIISLFFLFVACLTVNAWGCSCTVFLESDKHQVKVAKKEAFAVFAGEVSRVIENKHIVQAMVNVETAWKGRIATQVVVLTHNYPYLCGFPFKQGEKYLFYVDKDFQLDTCTRTVLFEDAQMDIKYLGKTIPFFQQIKRG